MLPDPSWKSGVGSEPEPPPTCRMCGRVSGPELCESCDRANRLAEEWFDGELAEASAAEHEQRCDMRRTFGLPPDPIDTDLF